ncbi:MAG: MFS transporter [Candidatus Hodarchaeales archaeon]|jgi:MFS family permease
MKVAHFTTFLKYSSSATGDGGSPPSIYFCAITRGRENKPITNSGEEFEIQGIAKMQWFNRRLDIAEMTPQSQSLARKYYFLVSTQIAEFQIAASFLVLFLLEIISFAELGILLATQAAITALLDYPTGALGDAIGHRNVLTLAYIFHALAICVLLMADSFAYLVLWAILSAVGRSQQSGTLQAWFDNNYKVTSGDSDADRKLFGAFMGKMTINFRVIAGLSFLVSGFIAAAFTRKGLFAVQLGIVIIALILIIGLMSNEEGVEVPKKTLNDYRARLAGGLRFATSSYGFFLFLVGGTLAQGATLIIWAAIMITPYYEGYTGADEYIGLLRSIVLVFGVVLQLIAIRLSKRTGTSYRSLFIATVMINIPFILLLWGYYELVPPENTLNLIKYIGLIIILFIGGISLWLTLQTIYTQRIMIKLVPDQYRNAVYSLQPTLFWIATIIMTLTGGFVLMQYGFAAGFPLILAFNSLGLLIYGTGLFLLNSSAETQDAVPIVKASVASR